MGSQVFHKIRLHFRASLKKIGSLSIRALEKKTGHEMENSRVL